MKFRSRLVLAITASTLITFGGAFAAVSIIVDRSEQRELDEAVLEAARSEAQELGQLPEDKLEISDAIGPASDDYTALVRYAVIYDATGKVIDATPSFACGKPPNFGGIEHEYRVAFNFPCGNLALRGMLVRVPAHHDKRLLMAVSRAGLDGDAAYLRRTMALALIVAIGAATAVTFGVVRELTRHYDAITQAARRVSDGDLSARVAITSGDPELVRLANDINDMVTRLGILVESQQRFIAYAAHELRSPVTAIYGELQLATRKERGAAEYREMIEEALDGTRRLKTLIDDLLALARLGADEAPMHAPVAVEDVLNAAVSAVLHEAEERGVLVKPVAESATVEGRARDLERLVRNLLDNAIRHSPRGGTVKAFTRQDGGRVEFIVEDEGPGVPEEDRTRIFEPFYRSVNDHDREGPGAGLGLAIVQEIARAHGGKISVGSAASGGARFVAEFPMRAESSSA